MEANINTTAATKDGDEKPKVKDLADYHKKLITHLN